MKHILIIDDDVHIGNLLCELLLKNGYSVSRAYSGTEAVLVLSSLLPDLILLDLMLPGLSGEEVFSRIEGIPTIILSAKPDIDGKVALLMGGAVDYVTKPFECNELLARIAVALREHSPRARILGFESLRLDTERHSLTADGSEIRLTRTELAILKALMQNSSRVVTKSRLLDLICEDTPDCTESSLKIHIGNLRKKLKRACDKDFIEAVWGIGYKLRED